MVHRIRILVVGLVVLAAGAAGAAATTPKPQLLVSVSATGGLCPPSMCHWGERITTATISAEGRRSRSITAAERSALTQAIARLKVATLPRFKGTCPIAYDGQEFHYRFRDKPEVRSCRYDLRRVRAVQLTDRLIASPPTRERLRRAGGQPAAPGHPHRPRGPFAGAPRPVAASPWQPRATSMRYAGFIVPWLLP